METHCIDPMHEGKKEVEITLFKFRCTREVPGHPSAPSACASIYTARRPTPKSETAPHCALSSPFGATVRTVRAAPRGELTDSGLYVSATHTRTSARLVLGRLIQHRFLPPLSRHVL